MIILQKKICMLDDTPDGQAVTRSSRINLTLNRSNIAMHIPAIEDRTPARLFRAPAKRALVVFLDNAGEPVGTLHVKESVPVRVPETLYADGQRDI
jgi:hypothetical protein